MEVELSSQDWLSMWRGLIMVPDEIKGHVAID